MANTLINRVAKLVDEFEREGMPPDDESDYEPLSDPNLAKQFEEKIEERKLVMFEIVRCIASQLGFAEPDQLNDVEFRSVVRDAYDAVENWESKLLREVEYFPTEPPVEPEGHLQKLLQEHHDVGEALADFIDDDIENDLILRGEINPY